MYVIYPGVFNKLKNIKVESFCAKEMQLLRSKPWSKSTIMKVKYGTKKVAELSQANPKFVREYLPCI